MVWFWGLGAYFDTGSHCFPGQLLISGHKWPPSSASIVHAILGFSQNCTHPGALPFRREKWDGSGTPQLLLYKPGGRGREVTQLQDQFGLYSKFQARLYGNPRKGKRNTKARRARWLTPTIPIWEAEAWSLLWVQCQPGLHSGFQVSLGYRTRPYLETIKCSM